MEKEFFSEHIRINISKLAFKIIQQDLVIFSFTRKLNFNGFINRLIYLYIKNSCESYDVIPNHTKIKGDSYEFRFNNDAMNEYNDSVDYLNKKYSHERATLFFKGILESYARLPFVKRETVILQNLIDDINKAINNKKQIKLKTHNIDINITPYEIVRSKEGSFSYLIGFDLENKIHAIRISHIRSLKLFGKAHIIPEYILINADEMIAEYGPTFVEEPLEEIHIQFLTEKAKLSYEYSIIHRPIHTNIIDKDNNIYSFTCSLKQAEYFFFRFAGEVKILKPTELKNKIVNAYRKGIEANN